MELDHALCKRMIGFIQRGEDHPFARLVREHQRDVVATHHRVLRRTHDWPAIRRSENVVGRKHQRVSFHLCFDRKRQVNRHLVTIEVRIESFADQRVKMDRVAFDKSRFERLNTHPVQCRSTVKQDRVVLNHLLKDIPNFFVLTLKHLLG